MGMNIDPSPRDVKQSGARTRKKGIDPAPA
jgi:hypothetical protein